MIGEGMFNLFSVVISSLPIISIPTGFVYAINFIQMVIGYVNYFLPVADLIPIIALIIVIRNFNISMAILNWVIRLVPFIG